MAAYMYILCRGRGKEHTSWQPTCTYSVQGEVRNTPHGRLHGNVQVRALCTHNAIVIVVRVIMHYICL